MKRTLSRRVTGTASAVIILVLLLGGAIYLRTASNASEIDNRNLRELSRIGEGIEGRVNNLNTVLRSLANDKEIRDIISKIDSLKKASDFDGIQIDWLRSKKNMLLKYKARLIPHFTVDTVRSLLPTPVDSIPARRTVFNFNLADESFHLWYNGKQDAIRDTIHARYDFSALQPTLSSDYMETVFLADEKGLVFMWESNRAGVRIHELAALDTLHFKANSDISGVGVSDIATISITGQDYRFYLLPLRINMSTIQPGNNFSETEYTKWILGGMVPVSEYYQSSLSFDPKMALLLGFMVVAGFLVVPFVRVFTMGPKERLRVSHLLYLVIALILGTGFTGLLLADVFYYTQLKEDINKQLLRTADTVVLNLDREIRTAHKQLNYLNQKLRDKTETKRNDVVNINSKKFEDIRMIDTLRLAPENHPYFYPHFHMVFWTNSEGMQIAKWTPRSHNTPRVNVGNREYFRAIIEKRGWEQSFHDDQKKNTCAETGLRKTGKTPYYIQSIRSWTTGENLASISMKWKYRSGNSQDSTGIAAITTELASLTKPVLPAGVNLAVVNANAQTLFHTRPERILAENFAEETNKGDLLRSVLAARVCQELELAYGGRQKMMVVRPLPERPLYLILFMDMALIDTVRFEAWFEGGALFLIWVILFLFMIFLLDRFTKTRMGWLWPDLEKPGKYAALIIIAIPFIAVFIWYALETGHLHIKPATLLVPVKFLGLALVVLSWIEKPNPRKMETYLGWAIFILAVVILVAVSLHFKERLLSLSLLPYPTNVLLTVLLLIKEMPLAEIVSGVAALGFVIIWLRYEEFRNFMDRWTEDFSTRWVYTIAMISGLLVIGILPGYLSYRFTFDDHSEHLVKYHQLELIQALAERHHRMNEFMSRNWDIDDLQELEMYLDEVAVPNYDKAYDNLIFGTSRKRGILPKSKDHASDLHDILHGIMGNHIPFLTEAAVKMRQLSEDQADRNFSTIQRKQYLQINEDEMIVSSIPVAGSPFQFWRIILFTVVSIVLITLVYWVSRLVFFDHMVHSKPLKLEDVLPKSDEHWKSMILVGTRSISRDPIRNRKDEVHPIDMLSLASDPDGTPQFPIKEIPNNIEALCLDHFDHRIEETAWNQYVLEFLERNTFGKNSKPIILFTSRDLNEALHSAFTDNTKKEEIKRRWDRVLGHFTKVILSDNVDSFSFEISMKVQLIRTLINDLENLIQKIKNDRVKGSDIHNNDRKMKETTEEEAKLKIEWLKFELDSLYKKLKSDEKNAKKSKSLMPAMEWVKHHLMKLYKGTRVWISISAQGNAERKVHREQKNVREVCNILINECGHHERLNEIGRQIMSRSDFFKMKDSEVIELVRECAVNYYSARWAILTDEEQLVTAQLAKGDVVNPKSRQAISRLFARGLIKTNPELQLDNMSFSNYVRETVSEGVLTRWERDGIPSTWEMIRGPIVFGLIIFTLFLFWAHRDFLGSTVAFLGTVGVGLGAILNLLGKLERGSAVNN